MSRLLDAVESFIEAESRFGRFLEPALIVALAGVFWAIQDVAVLTALGREGAKIRRAYVVSMAIHALQPAILWLLFGTASYLFASLLGSYGRLSRVYRLSGWGFVAYLPAGIAFAVGKYYAYLGRTVRELTIREEVDLGVKWNISRNLAAEVAGEPILVGMTVVACLLILSSAYVTTLAVDRSMSLDRRWSAIVAVTPPALYVLHVLSLVT